MRHWHSTPFEMCELKLHVRVPMDCWRQWIRHRTANVNEYSTRYSVAIDSAQCTAPGAWRLQAASNKQGSEGLLDADRGAAFSDAERALHEQARKVYQERLAAGIAREQARKDLPLSTYTEAYWKIDLGNLLHFLLLRMAPNAQLEIRSYAETIGNEIVARWCPLAWEAFLDYRFNAMGFSEPELKLIRLLSAAKTDEARSLAEELGFLRKSGEGWKPGSEGRELEEKLERLGLKAPW
jgi:thymidylate synthase (FAD)